MNLAQRVRSLIFAALLVLASIILFVTADLGYFVLVIILGITLMVAGVRILIYYFTMARHMVGGKTMLYLGIITLDIGAFALTIVNLPPVFIVLYLFLSHAFTGAVDILRAMEAKKYRAAHWRLRLTHGIVNIAVAFVCVILVRYTEVVVFIYALGLLYSALMNVITAFRRTSVVYIP